jgi:hypothetical protein
VVPELCASVKMPAKSTEKILLHALISLESGKSCTGSVEYCVKEKALREFLATLPQA